MSPRSPRLRRFSRLLPLLLALACLAASPAGAQTNAPARPAAEAAKQLDGARAALDQIERALQRADLGDAALHDLRERLAPLAEAARAPIESLAPELDAVKARLEQLGPKPAEKAPPESAEVSAERIDQQKQFDNIDAAIKRARLLAVEIDQTTDAVAARRRALFTRALFTRSFSIFSPELWISALNVIPGEARAMKTVTADWLSGLAARLQGWRFGAMAALTLLIAAFFVFVLRIERRVIFRDPAVHDPGDFKKSIAALWAMAVTGSMPIFAALAFLALMRAFNLANPRMEPLTGAVFDLVTRLSLTIGLTRGLLAPKLPNWRLVDVSEAAAASIGRTAFWIVAVFSVGKIGEACAEIIVASLPAVIVMRGITAMAVALILASGLRGFAAAPEDDECLGPVVVRKRDWRMPLRAAAWAAFAGILAAALVGYVALASFLADQLVWTVFVGSVLFLLTRVCQLSISAGLRPQAKFGRAVMANTGLRGEALDQIAILLSGAATLAMVMTAAMLALAPWGIESNDMLGNFRAAFFGFKVGEVTISLSSIIIAIVVFTLCWAAARALQRWLESSFLPLTQLDTGLRNSIRTSVGYIGFIIAVSLALGYLGLSFEKLAIVAGALSVGIGFGLQSIVNNFVSGLILLWERAIRVGDWVVVGDEQGYVRRINVRSTEIETFDRATMIVPNSSLVSGVVKNWVRNDRVGRIKNSVAVNIGADPEKVRDALLACAGGHELILKAPAPQVMFISMTDNMLRFDLVSFVEDVERAGRIKSDLNFAIFKSFGDAGLDLLTTPLSPPPTMTGLDRAESLVARSAIRE